MTRGKTLANVDFTVYIILKIFMNDYSNKHLKKNLLLKDFKSMLLCESKSKGSDIENRPSLVL